MKGSQIISNSCWVLHLSTSILLPPPPTKNQPKTPEPCCEWKQARFLWYFMLNIYFIIFSDVLERSVCPQSPVPSVQRPMFQCPIVMVHHPPTADQDSSSINWLWYLVVWKSGDRKDIEIERRVAGRERKCFCNPWLR